MIKKQIDRPTIKNKIYTWQELKKIAAKSASFDSFYCYGKGK